jgi:hypothetical protein
MGYKVEVLHNADYLGVYERIAQQSTDFGPEVWDSDFAPSIITKYVNQLRQVQRQPLNILGRYEARSNLLQYPS